MNLQARRHDRGWSQEDLAGHTGLSVRTIQRIESGGTASLETLKCLAAVFDTSITNLSAEENELDKNTSTPNHLDKEKKALEFVEHLKGLYIHIAIFVMASTCLAVLNAFISPDALWVHYVIISWVLVIGLQALITFGEFKAFGPRWEQRQFKKFMKHAR